MDQGYLAGRLYGRNAVNPTASVIVPCYRAGAYVEEAIRSVQAQTFQDWECLLINDGSDDMATLEALARIEASGDNRIQLLQHPSGENRGVSASRNLGLDHAHGRYVAFLDSDDAWLPEKLAKQVAVLESAPEHVGMVFCDFWECHDSDPGCAMAEQNLEPNAWGENLAQWFDGSPGATFAAMLKEPKEGLFNWVQSPTPLVRAMCFEEGLRFTGPPRLTVQYEDYLMWMMLAAQWDFIALPDRLAIYRVHDQSFTGRFHLSDESAHTHFRGLCQLAEVFEQSGVSLKDACALRGKMNTYATSRIPYANSLAYTWDLLRYHAVHGGFGRAIRLWIGVRLAGNAGISMT